MISFKVLSNNSVNRRGLIGEHGLSLFIEVDNNKILFDTGQTKAFSWNANNCGVELTLVDYIIISHGHYDHTGGLMEICKINNRANIFLHSKALVERYNAINGNPIRENIGIPYDLKNEEFEKRVIYTNDFLKLDDNIFLSGEIPRKYSDVNSLFVYKNPYGFYEEDIVLDEQFLAIKGKEGIYIFTGCSHAGVRNIIDYAKLLFTNDKIIGIIGGLHLSKLMSKSVDKVINNLISEELELVIPLHCTGMVAACEIKEKLREKCVLVNTGDEYIIEY